ncbi:MAG TPA: ferritin-like domain-containing protein [Polyangiaceae bacterium]|nr:ferritin-like domain-containing protein [Polyangiaceae bacterium]
MTTSSASGQPPPSREQLVHLLCEAAELEHDLMCTYLYAAFSLRDGEAEGLTSNEAVAVAGFRRTITRVAIEEMGHLAAVWNITSALGAAPHFGRGNFPLDPGWLPANIVVKLAPFGEEALQHFIHLERPAASDEKEGSGFEAAVTFSRGGGGARLVPQSLDYETVGVFYETLDERLRAFVEHVGESVAFCGDPALQLSPLETGLEAAKPVVCRKTASQAFLAIVQQGEGAPEHSADSHFQRFAAVRDELSALAAKNPAFSPAFPAAVNPVLRRPFASNARVWIEDERAVATVDLANSAYALMLRLLAFSYTVPRPAPEKALAVDLGLGLMRAVTHLGERAARLPAGPSHPGCHAGMSFTALRDASALSPGPSAARFVRERLRELAVAAVELDRDGDARTSAARRILSELADKADARFAWNPTRLPLVASNGPAPDAAARHGAERVPDGAPPVPVRVNGVDEIEGEKLTLLYEGKKCIHSRFCVTWGPRVFLANVEGPWIHPDAMDVEALAEIAHACPSGAIRYRRKDGKPDEAVPPVNLLAVREAGPYAVRADMLLDGQNVGFRATLCRCGGSKNKPYCDGTHKENGFAATGEPKTGAADMLPVRDGPLAIDPLTDGPLQVRGNLEITSGTGRVVARLTQAKLCRCGGSANKPFCDGTHARIGFKSS